MPSNRFSDEVLARLLKERAARLAKLVELDCPNPIIEREVGMVVEAARLLYGRENVDQQIDTFQAITDAAEAGLCDECLTAPILPGLSICENCKKESDEFIAGVNLQYGSPDSPIQ